MMLVSIVVPCFRAEPFIARAIRSVLRQGHQRWEVILVSDDGVDYPALLTSSGISDPRIRSVFTGSHGSGCHLARNVGLTAVQGDFVTQLDADDEFTPDRLDTLLPWAERWGAAADNLKLRDPVSGQTLYTVLGPKSEVTFVGLSDLLALSAPLVPVIARRFVEPRTNGVELAEDVIANMRLIAKIETLPVLPMSSYIYNIMPDSMCHEPDAEQRFAAAYGSYIERLRSGDGFGLPNHLRQLCAAGFEAKRALNDAFGQAARRGFSGNFQDFAALRGLADRASRADQEQDEA